VSQFKCFAYLGVSQYLYNKTPLLEKLFIEWQNSVPSLMSWYTAGERAVVDVQVEESLKQFSHLHLVPFRVLSRTAHEYVADLQ